MLTLNLKKKWFDKIKSGEKTHEYRIMSDYWVKRIHPLWWDGKTPDMVDRYMCDYEKGIAAIKFTYIDDTSCPFRHADGLVLCCGYPKKDDTEKRLYAKIKSITSNVNGLYTDLHVEQPVYDIEFELIKET